MATRNCTNQTFNPNLARAHPLIAPQASQVKCLLCDEINLDRNCSCLQRVFDFPKPYSKHVGLLYISTLHLFAKFHWNKFIFDLLSNWLSHLHFVTCVKFRSFARNAPRNIKGLAASTGKIFFKLLTNYFVYARSEVPASSYFRGDKIIVTCCCI